MRGNMVIYLLITILVTNLLRVLPTLLIRGRIQSRFLRSFLYYVPYVTLAVMTFPAIVEATQSPLAGLLALVAGLVAAFLNLGLFPVSAICCVVVFVAELLLK